jgi:hypothetical protein
MKCLALTAAGAAVIGLAACSQAGTPASAPAPSTSHSAVHVAVSCGQQYRTWRNGPGKGVIAALHSVSAAGIAGDTHVLTVALRKAGPAVAEATRHPIPACADPRGYWDVLLMHVSAAVASRHSAASVRAAMKGVPKIVHQLASEVRSMPGG